MKLLRSKVFLILILILYLVIHVVSLTIGEMYSLELKLWHDWENRMYEQWGHEYSYPLQSPAKYPGLLPLICHQYMSWKYIPIIHYGFPVVLTIIFLRKANMAANEIT